MSKVRNGGPDGHNFVRIRPHGLSRVAIDENQAGTLGGGSGDAISVFVSHDEPVAIVFAAAVWGECRAALSHPADGPLLLPLERQHRDDVHDR